MTQGLSGKGRERNSVGLDTLIRVAYPSWKHESDGRSFRENLSRLCIGGSIHSVLVESFGRSSGGFRESTSCTIPTSIEEQGQGVMVTFHTGMRVSPSACRSLSISSLNVLNTSRLHCTAATRIGGSSIILAAGTGTPKQHGFHGFESFKLDACCCADATISRFFVSFYR